MDKAVDLAFQDRSVWHLGKAWGWFVALGLGMLVLGMLAATNLVFATVATIIYVSAMMLVAGILQLVQAFMVRQWQWFLFWLIGSLLYLAAGAAIFAEPMLAASVMTIALALLLGFSGMVRLWIAFNEGARGRGWLALSAIASLAACAVIAAAWPANSIWVLGLVLAADLIVQGFALLFFGLAAKQVRDPV